MNSLNPGPAGRRWVAAFPIANYREGLGLEDLGLEIDELIEREGLGMDELIYRQGLKASELIVLIIVALPFLVAPLVCQ